MRLKRLVVSLAMVLVLVAPLALEGCGKGAAKKDTPEQQQRRQDKQGDD